MLFTGFADPAAEIALRRRPSHVAGQVSRSNP
jgi:hypothetical protein